MADVERTGRTALEEMRRLLGLLRSGEPADGEAGTADQLAGTARLPDGAYRPPQGLADAISGRWHDPADFRLDDGAPEARTKGARLSQAPGNPA